MSIVFVLIPLGLLLLALASAALVWAVRNGQFDDLDRPATSILLEESPPATDTDGEPRTPASNEGA
jgi:cbb3-type cytochrome oxidase maturation protein